MDKKFFDENFRKAYGVQPETVVQNGFVVTEIDQWLNDSVNNANETLVPYFGNNIYGILHLVAGVTKMTTFEIDDDGKVTNTTVGGVSGFSGINGLQPIGAVDLEDNKCFVCAGSKCGVVTISGTSNTPTLGTAVTLTNDALPVVLSSTKVLLVLGNGDFQIATISGTTVTLSSTFTISGYVTNANPQRMKGFAYDNEHVVLAGGDDGIVTTGYTVHLTIDSATPSGTQDSKIAVTTAAATNVELIVVNSIKFIVITDGKMRVIDRSGTVLSLPASEYSLQTGEYPSGAAIDSGTVAYLSYTSGGIYMKKLIIFGGALTESDSLQFMSGSLSFANTQITSNGYLVNTHRIGNSVNSFHHQTVVIKHG